jgi:hypothetical protein
MLTIAIGISSTRISLRQKTDLCSVSQYACRWGEFAIRVAGCLHLWTYGGRVHGNKIDKETMSSAIALLKQFFMPMQMKVIGAPRIAQLKKDGSRLKSYLSKNGNCTKTYDATANMKIDKDYLLYVINASDSLFEYDKTENTIVLGKRQSKD